MKTAREKFQIGDIVKLKSGGPAMTVSNIVVIGGPALVNCAWLTAQRNIQAILIWTLLNSVKKIKRIESKHN